MKKKLLLSFESPRDHYRAEATVIWCFDDRFTLALQVFQERMGWKNMDLIKVAGGVRDLGLNANEEDSRYLLEQIEKSIRLHKSPEVFLMAHYNCGAFGREQMEPTSQEDSFFAAELKRGKERVDQYLEMLGLKANVRGLLCDFKNIYEVDF